MPRTVLRPACPVCGQTLRSNDWMRTVGVRPIAVAHELYYARQFIDRRDLAPGERASRAAVVVVSVDEKGNPRFAPANGRIAPDGWLERLRLALDRAVEVVDSLDDDDSGSLAGAENREDFEERSKRYIAEAEASLAARKREVEKLAERWRKVA